MSGRIDINYTHYHDHNSSWQGATEGYNTYLQRWGTRIARGERYRKYIVLDIDDVHTVTKAVTVPSVQAGESIVSHMVQLGGPFEEVGGSDEIIGSADQALGSDIK